MNKTVKGLGCRVIEVESRISKLEDKEEKQALVVNDLLKQNHVLKKKITALEDFSRHQNIGIMGVKEGMEGGDWDGFVKTLLSEALDINANDRYPDQVTTPGQDTSSSRSCATKPRLP